MENTTLTKPQKTAKISQKTTQFSYTIESWNPKDAHALYSLEKICWAPWLRKPEKDFLTIASNYPELQRLIRNKNGEIVASMSVNRITWDGKAETLPSWDAIAGGTIETSDFTTTYTPTGNTLCLMSMNVSPDLQGIGLAQKLIEELKSMAITLKVKHITSSLRPTGYGKYKLEKLLANKPLLNFIDYCGLKNQNNEPYDRWLRSAFHQGMKQLCISKNSIVVAVDKATFEGYIKTYKPQMWKQASETKWECGETGSWFVSKRNAIYKEHNLAVEIPIKKN
jgi:hypothetical protein